MLLEVHRSMEACSDPRRSVGFPLVVLLGKADPWVWIRLPTESGRELLILFGLVGVGLWNPDINHSMEPVEASQTPVS